MSHELRTPLNAVIGFAEIMVAERLGPIGTPRYRDYARDIAGSGRHLLTIIEGILDLSKVEAGRLELAEEVVRPRRARRGVRAPGARTRGGGGARLRARRPARGDAPVRRPPAGAPDPAQPARQRAQIPRRAAGACGSTSTSTTARRGCR
jgi:hypothetical protein